MDSERQGQAHEDRELHRQQKAAPTAATVRLPNRCGARSFGFRTAVRGHAKVRWPVLSGPRSTAKPSLMGGGVRIHTSEGVTAGRRKLPAGRGGYSIPGNRRD